MFYNIDEMKSFFRRRNLTEKEQRTLLSFRRDDFDAYLCLVALDNAKSFGKPINRISIKEFLSAVEKNYEDNEYTLIMKNRMEAAMALFKGRDIYYDEDFFNSPTSSDPDMVYGAIANSIFAATTKINFSKNKYTRDYNGNRIPTENQLRDLIEDISALDFCYGVIAEDLDIMLKKNYRVDNDDNIPPYRKHLYKYSAKEMAMSYENAEFIEIQLTNVNELYKRVTKKFNRKIMRARNLQAIKNIFSKNKHKTKFDEQEELDAEEIELCRSILSTLSDFEETQNQMKTSAEIKKDAENEQEK